jgi:hypothetical protein
MNITVKELEERYKVIKINKISDDVELYKDLEKRLIITSFYKKHGGFGFRHFIKALTMMM